MRVALLALLLSGCATLPPFATEESMAERARCLATGRWWVETQRAYDCHRPPAATRTSPSPMPGEGFFITPQTSL